MKLTGLCAAIALTLASFGVYAGESHMAEALKHAEAAAKADDAKAIMAMVLFPATQSSIRQLSIKLANKACNDR